jgi:hypothetical protein
MKCAYPKCSLGPLNMGAAGDRSVWTFSEGFTEVGRSGGGGHGLLDGGRRLTPKVWHRACARAHWNDRRNGEQGTLV